MVNVFDLDAGWLRSVCSFRVLQCDSGSDGQICELCVNNPPPLLFIPAICLHQIHVVQAGAAVLIRLYGEN